MEKWCKNYGIKPVCSWWRRFVLSIPLINMIYSFKFKIDAVLLMKGGCPTIGTFREVRWFRPSRTSVRDVEYTIDLAFPREGYPDSADKVLILINNKTIKKLDANAFAPHTWREVHLKFNYTDVMLKDED